MLAILPIFLYRSKTKDFLALKNHYVTMTYTNEIQLKTTEILSYIFCFAVNY